MFIVLALIAAAALLAPLFGTDTRDGLDWAPNNFWLRRRGSGSGRSRPHGFRRTGSHARTSEARGAADACRTAPAAG